MFDLVPYVRGGEVVVEAFRIIFNFYFLLGSSFVLPLYKFFLKLVQGEGFHKRIEFFLLVVSS